MGTIALRPHHYIAKAILIIMKKLLTTIPHSLMHYQPQYITITAIMMIMKKLLTTILTIT